MLPYPCKHSDGVGGGDGSGLEHHILEPRWHWAGLCFDITALHSQRTGGSLPSDDDFGANSRTTKATTCLDYTLTLTT